MCGRFALGLSGGELEEAIARDYFQPPAHHQGARDQDGEQQQDGNEADEQEQAGGAAQDGEGSAPRDEVGKSTHQDALHWSSFEAQSTFRPRYNVRVGSRARTGAVDGRYFPSTGRADHPNPGCEEDKEGQGDVRAGPDEMGTRAEVRTNRYERNSRLPC